MPSTLLQCIDNNMLGKVGRSRPLSLTHSYVNVRLVQTLTTFGCQTLARQGLQGEEMLPDLFILFNVSLILSLIVEKFDCGSFHWIKLLNSNGDNIIFYESGNLG